MTTATYSTNAVKTLKNLIHILHDGRDGFRHAAENIKNPRLKETFNQFSLQRAKFAGALENELRLLGETDAQKEGHTISGTVHRGWIDLKGAFLKDDNHAILAEAERGEDAAKKAYNEALEEELPAPLLQLIASQASVVQATHDEVKALRDLLKKS
jgi:uncharacterized protein (TIGR02284 family)